LLKSRTMPETERPSAQISIPRRTLDVNATPAVEIQDLEYYSKALSRTQLYRCLVPKDAGAQSRQYPLLLLLHGFGGTFRDWTTYTRITRHLAGQSLIVVCPDGGNGWYTNAADGSECREDDLIHDLLPHLEATLPVRTGRKRAIAGLSMGGYGAIKLALKHPELFSCAASHSGAMDIAARGGSHPVFGDEVKDADFRRHESLSWLAEQALCRPPIERPRLYFDCGLNDPLLAANREFSDHLNFMGYGHTYRELPGYHTWPYWDRAFKTILPDIMRAIS